MDRARFGLKATYAVVVYLFFAYLANLLDTPKIPADVLFIGGLIMLGIMLMKTSLVSDPKS